MDEFGEGQASGGQIVDIEKDTTLSVRFTSASQSAMDVCEELLEGLQVKDRTLIDALFTTLVTAEQGGQAVRLDVKYISPKGSETKDLGVRIQKADPTKAARSIKDQFHLETQGWRPQQASMAWSRYFSNDIRFQRHRVPGPEGRDRLVVPIAPIPS